MSSVSRHCGRLLALASVLCLAFLASPIDAFAEDPVVEPTQVGTATIEVAEGWLVEQLPALDVGPMKAELAYISSPDKRVQALFAVIDPFGVDLQNWEQEDLLGPLVLDLVRSSGYESENFRVRRVDCRMNGEKADGRLVIFPKSKGRKRLISGYACGYRDASRWAFAAILVDSYYDRPLLLERSVDQAADMLESFSFPD